MYSVATVLSVSMLLAGCTSSKDANPATSTDPGKATAAASSAPVAASGDPQSKLKPVDFTQYVNYDWHTSLKFGDQPNTKYLKETLKINITPIQSNGAAAQKLNSMIVANELPDAIVLDRGKDVERLQQAGKLVALDPYLEKYPEFVKTVGEKTLNMLRSPDGKLYQIPNWYINGENGNGVAGYIVEKKIYKALGSPKLETWDDLEAYLKLVKEKYPDVVPFDSGEIRDGAEVQQLGILYSGAATDVSTSFVSPGAGQVFGIPKGNQLTSIYADPAFQETVLFTNKLFRGNLLSKDMFTQTRDQVKEKLNTGKIAVFGAFDAVAEVIGREANSKLKAVDPEDGYTAIWPVHKDGLDKNKVFPGNYSTLGWNVNVITTNAKDPEAIFAYMNWATSPQGQRIMFFGPEGMFYDKVENEVPIPNEAYIKRDNKKYDELKINEYNWYGNTSFIDGAKAAREKMLPAEAQDWTTLAQANVTFKTSKNITEFSNLDPQPNTEEGIAMQRLKDQYKQAIAKMVFAKSEDEVKSLLGSAQQEAVKLGYDKVLKWKTNVWQENLKKLGK
ncbi:extracellular solute-binding protein [Paenibacillus sp. SI8]|uniref:extracellular solute-binding protein n=1 Tax=unclassified Paenibacillus TaxID=185978 RepID=UPI0034666BB5